VFHPLSKDLSFLGNKAEPTVTSPLFSQRWRTSCKKLPNFTANSVSHRYVNSQNCSLATPAGSLQPSGQVPKGGETGAQRGRDLPE
jgi:hypothetical protein